MMLTLKEFTTENGARIVSKMANFAILRATLKGSQWGGREPRKDDPQMWHKCPKNAILSHLWGLTFSYNRAIMHYHSYPVLYRVL